MRFFSHSKKERIKKSAESCCKYRLLRLEHLAASLNEKKASHTRSSFIRPFCGACLSSLPPKKLPACIRQPINPSSKSSNPCNPCPAVIAWCIQRAWGGLGLARPGLGACSPASACELQATRPDFLRWSLFANVPSDFPRGRWVMVGAAFCLLVQAFPQSDSHQMPRVRTKGGQQQEEKRNIIILKTFS